jgi:hypothetical protein
MVLYFFFPAATLGLRGFYLFLLDYFFVNCFDQLFEIAYQDCRVSSLFITGLVDMDLIVYCMGQQISTDLLYIVELNYLIL